jgi:hypothetical protein
MFQTLTRAAALLGLSIAATATPAGASEKCGSMADLAAAVMTHRQLKNDLSEMIALANANGSPALKAFILELAPIAYGKPRYSTEKMQQNSINDFKNEVMLVCLRSE